MASVISCDIFLCLVLLCSCAAVINGGGPPPPRKKVAIEGVVYCYDCNYVYLNNTFQLVLTQTPIPGAVVKVQCNNTNKGTWEEKTTTDEKGGFSMRPTRVSSWGAHKCRLFLVSSPVSNCSSPGNPYPDPDAARWMSGFALTATAAVNASSPFKYYANTLPFFGHPTQCLP